MQLPGVDFLRAQKLRRTPEMLGKRTNIMKVDALGIGCEVAD